jgi:hypothetical protein
MRIFYGSGKQLPKGTKVVIRIHGGAEYIGTVVKPNGIVSQVETDEPGVLQEHRNEAGELWVNDFEMVDYKGNLE